MKIFQKTIAAAVTSAVLLGSLAVPFTVLAAAAKATVEPTAVATIAPTIEPTITPVTATPAPQSTIQWIMTHKKISLGVLVVIAVIGYVIFRSGKKNNQSPTEDQPKPEEPKAEEETKEEDQKPPEDTV